MKSRVSTISTLIGHFYPVKVCINASSWPLTFAKSTKQYQSINQSSVLDPYRSHVYIISRRDMLSVKIPTYVVDDASSPSKRTNAASPTPTRRRRAWKRAPSACWLLAPGAPRASRRAAQTRPKLNLARMLAWWIARHAAGARCLHAGQQSAKSAGFLSDRSLRLRSSVSQQNLHDILLATSIDLKCQR